MWHLLWDEVKECGINKPAGSGKMNTEGWIPREIVCDCGKKMEILSKPKKSV
jgi:hypothetical protein